MALIIALGFVFDFEAQASEIPNSGVVLADLKLEDLPERNPFPVRVRQEPQYRSGLSLKVAHECGGYSVVGKAGRDEVNLVRGGRGLTA